MSVLAWDGAVFAADRMYLECNYSVAGPKAWMVDGSAREVCGVTGEIDRCMAVLEWYRGGRKPEAWPEFQKDNEDWCRFVVVGGDGTVREWQRVPHPPIVHEQLPMAWGSGAEAALVAMSCGASADVTVAAVGKYSTSCGRGVDAWKLCNGVFVRVAGPVVGASRSAPSREAWR